MSTSFRLGFVAANGTVVVGFFKYTSKMTDPSETHQDVGFSKKKKKQSFG
jgi:hypothetical protein